jgi:hypothetical protein
VWLRPLTAGIFIRSSAASTSRMEKPAALTHLTRDSVEGFGIPCAQAPQLHDSPTCLPTTKTRSIVLFRFQYRISVYDVRLGTLRDAGLHASSARIRTHRRGRSSSARARRGYRCACRTPTMMSPSAPHVPFVGPCRRVSQRTDALFAVALELQSFTRVVWDHERVCMGNFTTWIFYCRSISLFWRSNLLSQWFNTYML